MGNGAELVFKIRADSKEAQDDLKKFRKSFDDETKNVLTVRDRFQALGHEIGLTDGQMASIAKTAPLVAAGIGVVAGAAIGLGAALAIAVHHAAETGDRFKDLSIQTGLSVETLSGLELSLKQNNASLETLASTTFILQKNLGAAKNEGGETATVFRRLGVDINAGPEQALRQLLVGLAKIPDLATRNELGAKAMGRGYKELSIFVNNTNGDIDSVIESARKAGLVMSTEAADGADEFKDHLEELSAQADMLQVRLGNSLIPTINRLARAFGQAEVEGGLMDAVFAGIAYEAQKMGDQILHSTAALRAFMQVRTAYGPAFEAAYQANLLGLMSAANTKPGAKTAPDPLYTGAGVNVPEALRYRPKISDEQVNAAQKKGIEEWLKEQEKKQKDAERKAEQEARKAAAETLREQERQAGVVKKLADEYASLASQVAHFTASEVEQRIAAARLTSGIETLTGERKKEAEALLALNAQEMRNLDVKQKIKEAQDKAKEDEKEMADRRADASDKFREALREELGILTDENEHLKQINDTITEATILGAIDAQTAAWLRTLAVINDIGKQIEKIGITPDSLGGLGDLSKAIPQAPGQAGGPWVDPALTPEAPPPPNLDGWKQALGSLKDMAGGTFKGVTQGFAQMVSSFILGAGASGQSFKTIARNAISAFTSMALVQALMELAYGFAALTPWGAAIYGPAAFHFKSAALLGAAAAAGVGIGALVGKGGGETGGSAFSGGGGSPFGGGFGSSTQDSGPRVIEQSRNTLQQQVIILRVESNDSHVVSVIRDNVSRNGELRNLIVETAAA